MQKLKFIQEIQAPASKVYETMLGLKDKSTYEAWTALFNPTSSYEGNWAQGEKILFIGYDENGKKGGMIAQVEEHVPAQRISLRHYGILDGDEEVTSGEQIENWAGAHEDYTFENRNGNTTVIVEVDVNDEYLDYFEDTYPKALLKLKELCEN